MVLLGVTKVRLREKERDEGTACSSEDERSRRGG
jgi:hypothetical protein